MHLSTAIAFANVAGLVAARPMRTLSVRDVLSFPVGMSWDILLDKGNDGKASIKATDTQNVQAIDIDLFTTSKETIQDLKSNMKVICYFSAGSKEDGRPDTGNFTTADYRNELVGWPGEFWLDVKSENVHNIMKKRIDLAVENGCDAVDPDNVDGYGKDKDDQDKNKGKSSDGFDYDKSAYADYVKLLAEYANHHQVRPIAIGLKNAIELFQEHPDVITAVQFAVNEECKQYGECGAYKAFSDVGKAVFNIEYMESGCDSSNGALLSTVNKPDKSLTTLGGACPASGNNGNQLPATPTSAATPTGGKSTAGPYPTALPTQQTSSLTGAAPKPTPTKGQGDDDNSDNGDYGDDSNDNDDDEKATSTRAGGRPTGYSGWGHGKGHKGQGRHSHSSLAASATPTPTDE